MKSKCPTVSRLVLALATSGVIFSPSSFADLALYDTAIDSAHGGGAGTLPYAAALITPEVFDGTNASVFDFGSITGPATIEVIIEGDPDAGGQSGYIGGGSNTDNSLRYEQWDDTGSLGFTRIGVRDYVFAVPSPTEPTHIAYRWDGADTMELFVDGILTGTVTGATFEMPSGVGLIGNVSDGGNQGLIGTIHRLTTYDSAVDDAAILKHAEAWLSTGDPSIGVSESVNLELNGSAQSFDLPVKNIGEVNPLTVTAVTVDGVNADYFTINTTFPFTLDPGETKMVNYTVDPGGENGDAEARFTISNNAVLNSEAEVQVSGYIRNPQISVQASLSLGITNVAVTKPVVVENVGGSRVLTLEPLQITGIDAAKFSAVGPTSIASGTSGNIDVTFTPDGSPGVFTAQLEIKSDDLGSPVTIVALSAVTPITEGFLTSYDSVIAADHGGGTGLISHQALLSIPSAFDGTNSTPFDFGTVSGDATFEFILEGDPVTGGQNAYLATAENPVFSLRYEQWDDTGVIGFTHAGVEDYVFIEENDATLLDSPTSPTHMVYRWQLEAQTMSLYIDGELAGTHVGSNFEMPTGLGLLGNNVAGTEGLVGTIHRVTIYNSDIGEDAIKRHANAFVTGAGASDFIITSVDLDQEQGLITIKWNAIPGVSYAVDSSPNLADWRELDDSLVAESTTESYTTSSILPDGQTKVFLRVRRP